MLRWHGLNRFNISLKATKHFSLQDRLHLGWRGKHHAGSIVTHHRAQGLVGHNTCMTLRPVSNSFHLRPRQRPLDQGCDRQCLFRRSLPTSAAASATTTLLLSRTGTGTDKRHIIKRHPSQDGPRNDRHSHTNQDHNQHHQHSCGQRSRMIRPQTLYQHDQPASSSTPSPLVRAVTLARPALALTRQDVQS